MTAMPSLHRRAAAESVGEMGWSIRQRSDAEARAIFDVIRGAVAAGQLSAGQRLPPEKVLCAEYGSSRHTVRKAMTLLERNGLVVRYVGRGSFIVDPGRGPAGQGSAAPAGEAAPARAWTLFELTEARLMIEPQLAGLVVERAGPEDLAAIADCLDAVARAGDWPSFKEAKYAFHLAVVRAARNDFLSFVFEQIIASRRSSAWRREESSRIEVESTKTICLAESRAIISALAGRDIPALAEAIRKSILRIILAINEM